MSSFVNLMGNDRWTETDIVNRTEAILRSQFSAQEETIINRKVTGQQLGQYTMTAAEQAELSTYSAFVMQAQAEGMSARADAALVHSALDIEEGAALLADASQQVQDLVSQRAAYRASLEPALPDDVPPAGDLPAAPADPTPPV